MNATKYISISLSTLPYIKLVKQSNNFAKEGIIKRFPKEPYVITCWYCL